jgi:hypothetical protein
VLEPPRTDVAQLVETISSDLQEQADPAYRELVRTRYSMEVEHFFWVRTPVIKRIAGVHYKPLKSRDIDERLELCYHLLETRVYEHKIIAFRWAHLARKDYWPTHLAVFAGWLDECVDDWIDCGDLCIHVIGEFLLRYPDAAKDVVDWHDRPTSGCSGARRCLSFFHLDGGSRPDWCFA